MIVAEVLSTQRLDDVERCQTNEPRMGLDWLGQAAHGHVLVAHCLHFVDLRVVVDFLVDLGEYVIEHVDDLLRVVRVLGAERAEVFYAAEHERYLFVTTRLDWLVLTQLMCYRWRQHRIQ